MRFKVGSERVNDADSNNSDRISIKLSPFANGTSILITGKNLNKLASNLNRRHSIISWFDKNRRIFNKEKSLA
jgi:hypothetical protein